MVEEKLQMTDSSPKLENERPLTNGAYPQPAPQKQVPPRTTVEARENQAETLRAPPPRRTATQDLLVSGTPAGSTSNAETSKPEVEASAQVEVKVEEAKIAELPIETVDAEVSMDVDPVRPSSPLSDLPHSQPPAAVETEMDVIPTQEAAEIVQQPAAVRGDDAGEASLLDQSDFDKTLQSIIEHGESSEMDYGDVTDIIEDNRYKVPMELPLPVEPRDPAVDVFTFPEDMLEQHAILEPFILKEMQERDERRGIKIFKLRQEYKELNVEWQVHCARLEKIRDRQNRRHQAAAPPLTPAIDASGLPFVAAPATPSILAPSGRTNRRNAAASLGYGDAARSEAEFLEILARLEDADMADPNLRAMRTTATVPDVLIDKGERDLLSLQTYSDENGLVKDPFEHYGINKVPDNWTEEEIAIFCRRYATHPKQFGKIAAALPNKTTPQCVLFYYRSKKKIDFRALVDKRSRDGKRKKGKKGEAEEEAPGGGAKKGPSLLGNLKRSRVDDEEDDEDDDEPQTPGSDGKSPHEAAAWRD